MKIGIITHPLYTNYGGLLQAYALQTILERMGHEVYEIEIKRKKQTIPFGKYPFCIAKRFIKKYLLGVKNQKIFLERYENNVWPIISSKTKVFVDRYMHQKLLNSYEELEQDFDAFIVGSDQVWRYKYFPWFGNDIANVYLKFASGKVRKIAYAASFGTDEWEYPVHKTEECKALAKLFDAISVREESGVKLCKSYLGIEAVHVLDPTMLLQKNDYELLIKEPEVKGISKTLFCYILDSNETKNNIIQSIASKHQLVPIYVNAKVYECLSPIEERIQPPVEAWLGALRDSQFVITDSFHACVFSILFHKQFAVIGNKERGMARFVSLLSMFGLVDRLVTSYQEILHLSPINYNPIDDKLRELRLYSISFLRKALNITKF